MSYRNTEASPRRRPLHSLCRISLNTYPRKCSVRRKRGGTLACRQTDTCSVPVRLVGSACRHTVSDVSSPIRRDTFDRVRIFFATIPTTWRTWVSIVPRAAAMRLIPRVLFIRRPVTVIWLGGREVGAIGGSSSLPPSESRFYKHYYFLNTFFFIQTNVNF